MARLHPRQRLRPLPPRRRSLGGDVHISRSCCCFSSRSRCCSALALACAAALLLLSVPYLVCSCSRYYSRSCSCLRCCSDLATLQSTESTFGSVDFQGVCMGGGLAGVKEEPAAAWGGSPERYPTIYLRVQGGGGGRRRWWGSLEKKPDTGEPRGMAGAAADRRWGVFSGRVGRRTAGRGRRGAAVWPVVDGGLGGGG